MVVGYFVICSLFFVSCLSSADCWWLAVHCTQGPTLKGLDGVQEGVWEVRVWRGLTGGAAMRSLSEFAVEVFVVLTVV